MSPRSTRVAPSMQTSPDDVLTLRKDPTMPASQPRVPDSARTRWRFFRGALPAALCLAAASPALAQQNDTRGGGGGGALRGHVASATRVNVAGASIHLNGTTLGASSDAAG